MFLKLGIHLGTQFPNRRGGPSASQIGDPCGYIISQPTRWGPPASQIREAAAGAQTHANVYLRTHPRTRAAKLASADTDEVGEKGVGAVFGGCVGAHCEVQRADAHD